MPAARLVVKVGQRDFGRFLRRRATADRHAVATRRDNDAEFFLDAREVPVVLAEQRRQQPVVIEVDLERHAAR